MGAPTPTTCPSTVLLHSPLSHTPTGSRVCFTDLIRQKGDTTMTVEQLTQEIIPRGRGTPSPHAPGLAPDPLCVQPPVTLGVGFTGRAGTVPDDIKAELLQRIRKFAEQA